MSSFSSSYTRGIVDLTSINDGDLAKASWCGGGGFGEVFVLEHKDLGKLAMKRLRETGSRENASDQRRVGRFAQERRAKHTYLSLPSAPDERRRHGKLYSTRTYSLLSASRRHRTIFMLSRSTPRMAH